MVRLVFDDIAVTMAESCSHGAELGMSFDGLRDRQASKYGTVDWVVVLEALPSYWLWVLKREASNNFSSFRQSHQD